jgi:putative ABC transport system permease protein
MGRQADLGTGEVDTLTDTGQARREHHERRSEIGLRRALGATKGHIRIQFLAVALLGGAAGVATGTLATAVYASTKGWAVVIPALAWGGGLSAALAIGGIAGLLPALRAARMSPTEALWAI